MWIYKLQSRYGFIISKTHEKESVSDWNALKLFLTLLLFDRAGNWYEFNTVFFFIGIFDVRFFKGGTEAQSVESRFWNITGSNFDFKSTCDSLFCSMMLTVSVLWIRHRPEALSQSPYVSNLTVLSLILLVVVSWIKPTILKSMWDNPNCACFMNIV